MFKKIKNIKNKVIIILAVVSLLFVSSTIYLVYSNFIINKRLDTLYYYISALHKNENSIIMIDDDSWSSKLLKRTGLNVKVPDEWNVDTSYVKIDKVDSHYYQFRIVFNIHGKYTFEDFTSDIYNQAKKMAYEYGEDSVYTWKDGTGYIVIDSFSDAIYGNIFYDKHDDNDENSGMRHKVKMLNENNQLILEVDYYEN